MKMRIVMEGVAPKIVGVDDALELAHQYVEAHELDHNSVDEIISAVGGEFFWSVFIGDEMFAQEFIDDGSDENEQE